MMKRITTILLFVTLVATIALHAQRADDTRALRQQVEALKQRVGSAERENRQLRDEIATLRQEQARRSTQFETRIDSIEHAHLVTDSTMSAQALESQHNHETISKRVDNERLRTLIAVGLIVLTLLAAWWFFARRMKRDDVAIRQIRDTQEKLSGESIKLDTQLLQLMDRQLALAQMQAAMPTATTAPGDDEHSLALKVADEIARIEMNLSRMDPDTRGLKQLAKAVDRIRDNFLSRGYEIVEMLGKPYIEGAKASVSFEDDESLPEGTRIVTRIVKPQVNYNGIMIQAAQITVSQNI